MRTYICIYVLVHVHLYAYAYVYLYVCVCVCARVFKYKLYAYTYTCKYIYLYIYTYICLFVYIYIYTFICVCVQYRTYPQRDNKRQSQLRNPAKTPGRRSETPHPSLCDFLVTPSDIGDTSRSAYEHFAREEPPRAMPI